MFHVIIQSRMGSSRLPGKVLMAYKNTTPLCILIKKLKRIKRISKIIIATTKLKKDDVFIKYCKIKKIHLFRGSNTNVLKRFYETSKKFKSQNIIRITSDCPFIDIATLEKMIKFQIKKKYDYIANTYPLPCTYPDGSDIEIFTSSTLFETFKKVNLPSDKEHVTKFMWSSKIFKIYQFKLKKNLSKYRYTLDIIEDFKLYCFIVDSFPGNGIYKVGMNEIVKLIQKNLFMIKYQKKIKRNFGWNNSLERDKEYLNV